MEPRGIAVLFVSVLAQTTILTVSLAAALLALFPTLGAVAWLLRRAIVSPLTAMGLAAQGIREGALELHLPSSRVQEIADVATALETMSAGLREAVDGGDLTATNSATGGAVFTGTLPSALPASSATTAAAPTPSSHGR